MFKPHKFLQAAALIAALGWAANAAAAWPEKPIRLILPFPAGGATDFMARTLGQKLGERLGQTVVIDNRAGAGGGVAAEAVAGAAPDGYTLFFATMGTLAINPSLYPKLRYDPVKDFATIAITHATANVLVVHPQVAAKNVAELIALGRAKPTELTFGSAGNGSSSHLAGEYFKTLAGIEMTHVPYKGTAPALVDLLSGRISMMFDTISVHVDNIKTGKVRALGVTSAARTPALPEVPTIAESGLPGYDVSIWLGVLAPVNTPKDIVARLNADIVKVMSDPEMKKQMTGAGIEARASTPEQFAAAIAADTIKWSKIVKTAGARLD